MTGVCHRLPDPDTDEHEERLQRLRASGASKEAVADAAWACMTHLLDLEHAHLAALHAAQYGGLWGIGRKLIVLERLVALSMTTAAIQLCCSWRAVETCQTLDRQLYQELFPKLPPRTDKKEKP